MIVLITQPTFLPWIGYFDQMRLADIIVFLDSVQYERRGWHNRNRIVENKEILLIWVIKVPQILCLELFNVPNAPAAEESTVSPTSLT